MPEHTKSERAKKKGSRVPKSKNKSVRTRRPMKGRR